MLSTLRALSLVLGSEGVGCHLVLIPYRSRHFDANKGIVCKLFLSFPLVSKYDYFIIFLLLWDGSVSLQTVRLSLLQIFWFLRVASIRWPPYVRPRQPILDQDPDNHCQASLRLQAYSSITGTVISEFQFDFPIGKSSCVA